MENLKVAICVIGKDENAYAREWIEYHKSIGVDNIILYDNNDPKGEEFNVSIGDYIEDKYVILKDYRGRKHMQVPSYNACFKEYKDSYDYIVFIDFDEFIVLKEHTNIKDFIKSLNSPPVIILSWMCDDHIYLKYFPCKLLDRTYHKLFTINGGIKSLVRTDIDVNYIGAHYPIGDFTYTNSSDIEYPFVRWENPITYEHAYIKHASFKSLEESIRRRLWRADVDTFRNKSFEFITSFNLEHLINDEVTYKMIFYTHDNKYLSCDNTNNLILSDKPCIFEVYKYNQYYMIMYNTKVLCKNFTFIESESYNFEMFIISDFYICPVSEKQNLPYLKNEKLQSVFHKIIDDRNIYYTTHEIPEDDNIYILTTSHNIKNKHVIVFDLLIELYDFLNNFPLTQDNSYYVVYYEKECLVNHEYKPINELPTIHTSNIIPNIYEKYKIWSDERKLHLLSESEKNKSYLQ